MDADRDAPLQQAAQAGSPTWAESLGRAAWLVASRTLWWGGWGLLVGMVAAILVVPWLRQAFPGPWLSWAGAVAILATLVYPVGWAGALGYTGFGRGVGRTVLHLGLERGWVKATLDGFFDQLIPWLRKRSLIGSAMNRSEQLIENLPLATWEQALKGWVDGAVGDDKELAELSGVRRGIGRQLKRFLVKRIERYLLRIVRAEVEKNAEGERTGGGGVSMQRVRELAYARSGDFFKELVVGLMNKQTALALALGLAASGLLPGWLWWRGR